MKRRVNFEAAENSENAQRLFAALREEEAIGDDNDIEPNPFFFIYSLITTELTNKLKSIVPFYNYLSYSSSHRYLALKVFRT
jgi:hypothetical protein